MRRRELLTRCAAVAASTTLSIAKGDAISSPKPVVVAADVDRWGQPIRPSGYGWVKVSSKDTGGAWAMFESPISPGSGVPLHLHHHQEEWFYVLAGEFLIEVGGEQHELATGMSILGPRQVPHRFRNKGLAVGKLLILVQPAALLEECFAALSQLPEKDRQNAELLKKLVAQYDIEIIGPPLP